MPKRTVDLPVGAGVYTEQTPRGAIGRWKSADKVRFRYGLAEKLGGWVRVNNMMIGLARRLWDWASLDGRLWTAIGTESKLYIWQNNTLYDITPLRRTLTLVNPFDTTISSDIVQVTDAAHAAQGGDYVRYSGATPVGGLTIDGEYQIQSITGVNTYTIKDDQIATSTATGGGTVPTEYDISVGLTSTSFGTGWGTGSWSQETWNTPRTISTTVASLRTWSLDNWGEDLIASPRGGSIYWWDRGTGPTTRAVLLDAAPTFTSYMIISQRDRHMFALGATDEFTNAFDPLLIRWSSKEDFGDWVPTSTNTSGDLRIFRGSKILTAVRTRGEILIFTDVSVHQINYLGGFSVYGIAVAGENVSILGPNAVIAVDYRVFFMAEGDFYIYDGLLRVLQCDIRNHVYNNLTVAQKDKVFAGLNREFNEIWFFYPGKDGEVWFESDFSVGDNSIQYSSQSMSGAQRYSIAFNAAGYTYLASHTASTNYDSLWMLRSNAEIDTPLEADYEVVFVLNGLTCDAGVVIEVTDTSGAADSGADNVAPGIFVTINAATDRMNFRKRVVGVGTLADLDNGATFYDVGALSTPIAFTDESRYGIIVKRSADTISGYLYDEDSGTTQLVASIALSAAEIIEYTGAGVPGVVLRTQLQALVTDDFRLESFRSAPADILVNTTDRGVSQEVNNYAIYNYQSEVWAMGTMERTAWHDRSPIFNDPYSASTDGYLYQHEVGNDDNGAAMFSFIESADMEVPESGEYLAHIDKMIPDFLELNGSVDITFQARKYPHSPEVLKGPYPVTPTTGKVSVRVRGRQISLRVESSAIGDRWRMGTLRVRYGPHGKRA